MRYSILLVISGSIAAYKSLELIRRLREQDVNVRCILTEGGAQFITPLSVASLSENPVYTELFSLKDETEMGHIRLTREADLVVVAPASADLIAKMAHGYASDLASAALLAANRKILLAPAMNAQMWANPATQRNIAQLVADGVKLIAPGEGELACGEVGAGRMAEPHAILNAVMHQLQGEGALRGAKALVTSGPTYEAIDPVRFIGNHSSGKQGHAIAVALAKQGAQVTLVTGPTAQPDPRGVQVAHVTSAEEMLAACESALPADIAVCAAAVADWRVSQPTARKLKKATTGAAPELRLIENPDILAHLAQHPRHRPGLVVGFAAETENVLQNAAGKRTRKACDWIIANDVSGGKAFGAEENTVTLITAEGMQTWAQQTKEDIAAQLIARIIEHRKAKP